jgi:hypothetical protein
VIGGVPKGGLGGVHVPLAPGQLDVAGQRVVVGG